MGIRNTTSKEFGATLVESLVVLAIMSTVVASMMYWVDMGLEDMKSQQAAQYQQRIVTGVNKFLGDPVQNAYVKANATTTVPVKVQVATLVASNYVQAGTGATNSYNQTPCALIYYDSTTSKISALITTEGGNPIPEGQLPYIAANAGEGGGFISTASPAVAKGAFGSWAVNLAGFTDATAAKNCSGSAASGGRLATMLFQEGSGSLQADYLYRDQVTGRPDLNTMNTPILFGASAVKTSGGACTPNGSLARDANGGMLSCRSGVWAGGSGGLNWKGSVATISALPSSPSPGDTYRVTNLGNHIFSWDSTNSVWQGLVVDALGALNVPGVMYASGSNAQNGSLTIYGQKNGWSGINFRDDAGNNAGTLMMAPSYSGFFNSADNAWRWQVDNSGNTVQAGNADVSTVRPTLVVTNGAACPGGASDTGKIAREASGIPLVCRGGYWRKTAAAPTNVFRQSGDINTLGGFFNAGTTTDLVTTYCKYIDYTVSTTALVLVSSNVWSLSTQANYSQLISGIYSDTGSSSSNYVVSTANGGGFNVSAALNDTVPAGSRRVTLCIGGRGLSGPWNMGYTVSVIE